MTTLHSPKLNRWSSQAMAVAALAAFGLTLAHPSATRQFTWPWVGILALVWLIPLGTCMSAWAFSPEWKRPNRLLSIGLLFLTLVTLISASLSPYATLSLLRIWPTLAGVALCFWLHNWLAKSPNVRNSRAVIAAHGIAIGGAILVIVSAIAWRWETAGGSWAFRNTVPFGHSTYTAGILVLLLPWLIHAAAQSQGLLRGAWLLLVATGGGVLLTTSSRGGVMALVVGGLIGVGYILFRTPWTTRTKVLVVCLTLGILLSAIYINPRLLELVRSGRWGESAKASNLQRSAMIEAGWHMGQARPWLGWGPGTVPVVYPQMRGELSGGADNVLQLHNTPIQLWATLGCGGACAVLLLGLASGRRLWQLTRQLPPEPIALTAGASLIGYALFSLTDHQLDLPAMNALVALNLALLFFNHGEQWTMTFTPRSRRITIGLVAIMLAIPVWLTGRDLWARHACEQALGFLDAGDPGAALIRFETAAQRAPYDPHYRHQIAGQLLAQRARSSDAADQRRLTALASAQLNQSLTANCFQEFAHFNLGWLALDNDAPASAARHFVAAAQTAPHRSGIYFGLGLALRATGDEPGAIRAFALEWVNDPITSTAPVWEWPDFAPLRPRIEHEASALLAELAPDYPAARYVRELFGWWTNGAPRPSRGFNPETERFVAQLKSLAPNQIPLAENAPYAWAKLFSAWNQATDSKDMTAMSSNDDAFASALAARKLRHAPPDWHGYLAAGLENEPALLSNSRTERTGYGVLALHPDAPILTDLYVRQQNRFVSTFASTLFPTKGWIPARELIHRLPTLTPATP